MRIHELRTSNIIAVKPNSIVTAIRVRIIVSRVEDFNWMTLDRTLILYIIYIIYYIVLYNVPCFHAVI